MRYVELMIQGVKRFTESHRINLNQSHLWLAGGTARGKTTVTQLIRASLDFDYFESIKEDLSPWRPTQDACRFALIFEHNDQRYRISRDIPTGGAWLAQFNSETKKYDAISQDVYDIRDRLTDLVDFPEIDDWSAAYLWTQGGGMAAEAVPQAASGPIDEDAVRERLTDLQAERGMIDSVDNVQFELDDLENKQWELEDELKVIAGRFEVVEQLEHQLERTSKLKDIDPKIIDRARNQDSIQGREEDQKIKLEIKVDELKEELEILKMRPLWHKDKFFVALCVFTLAGFIVPVVLKLYTFSLLGFAGLVVGGPAMAWIYKKHMDLLAELSSKLDELKQEQKELISSIEAGRRGLSELIKELDAYDEKEIIRLSEERESSVKELEERKALLSEENLEGKRDDIQTQVSDLKDKIQKMNDLMQGATAGGRDARDIDEEIAALERQLRGGKAPITSSTGSTVSLSPAERIKALVSSGARISRRGHVDFATVISPVVTKIINAVFQNEFKSIDIDGDGSVSYTRADDLEPMPEREIFDGLQRVTAAAIMIAAAKVSAQIRSFPVWWDEPFEALDDATLNRLATVAVKAIGDIQLIAVTGRRALGSAMGDPMQLPSH